MQILGKESESKAENGIFSVNPKNRKQTSQNIESLSQSSETNDIDKKDSENFPLKSSFSVSLTPTNGEEIELFVNIPQHDPRRKSLRRRVSCWRLILCLQTVLHFIVWILRGLRILSKPKPNRIKTARYTAWTFLPKALWDQFKRPANIYFAAISALAFTPISPYRGVFFTLGFLVVLLLSLIKEAIEDWHRNKQDDEINRKKVEVVRNNQLIWTHWEDLVAGDIVRIREDEQFPADLILISSSHPNGRCFVSTANLDGETNLKVRQCLKPLSSLVTERELSAMQLQFYLQPPKADIDSFNASLIIHHLPTTHDTDTEEMKARSKSQYEIIPITLSQLLVRGTVLKNTEFIFGVVAYVGKDTKYVLNSTKPPSKRSDLERNIDRAILVFLALVVVLCLGTAIVGAIFQEEVFFAYWYLDYNENFFVVLVLYFFTFVALFSSIVPIALYVSLEFVRVGQAITLYMDPKMYDEDHQMRARARTSNLNEQLGQVEILFTDKTGTLTLNRLFFRMCFVANKVFGTPQAAPDNVIFRNFFRWRRYFPFAHPSFHWSDTSLLKFLSRLSKFIRHRDGSLFPPLSASSLPGQPPPQQNNNDTLQPNTNATNKKEETNVHQTTLETNNQIKKTQIQSRRHTRGRSQSLSSSATTEPRENVHRSSSLSPSLSRHHKKRKTKFRRNNNAKNNDLNEKRKYAKEKVFEGATLFFLTLALCHNVIVNDQQTHVSLEEPPSSNPSSPSQKTNRKNDKKEHNKKSKANSQKKSKKRMKLEVTNSSDMTEGIDLAAPVNFVVYQSTSPDEKALVDAARNFGFCFVDRNFETITLNIFGIDYSFQLLHSLDFTSQRKRMSVIVKLISVGDRSLSVSKSKLSSNKQNSNNNITNAPLTATKNDKFANPTTKEKIDEKYGECDRDKATESPSASQNERIFLFMKGADSVVIERAHSHQQYVDLPTLVSQTKELASRGLRTLVMGYRELSAVEYNRWLKKYYLPASQNLSELRNELMDRAHDKIERNIQLLGVTGIEDKLQPGVSETIESLLSAGIKVWMLTGDKQETCISVAVACGLVNKENVLILNSNSIDETQQQILSLMERIKIIFKKSLQLRSTTIRGTDNTNKSEQQEKKKRLLHQHFGLNLKKIKNKGDHANDSKSNKVTSINDKPQKNRTLLSHATRIGLVVDGMTLQYALSPQVIDRFMDLTRLCDSVLVCRASPGQKEEVVKVVRRLLRPIKTCAIGDGANDVAMLQAAHVGIGLPGEEGRQAIMASDFQIGRFSLLRRLLLVHGRYYYHRMCTFALYMFYKNMFYSIIQLFWNTQTGFSGQTYFNDLLGIGYNLIFTALPIIVVATLDKDVPSKIIYRFPHLYTECQKGVFFNWKTMSRWILLAIAQAFIVWILPTLTFSNVPFTNGQMADMWLISTVVFSCMIFVVSLQLAFETRYWTILHHLAMWGSIALWIVVSLIISTSWILPFYPEMYGLTFIFYASPNYYFTLVITTTVALLPEVIWLYVERTYIPKLVHIAQEVPQLEAIARSGRKPLLV
jgi:magnesium-transporting ATPase (P-type)